MRNRKLSFGIVVVTPSILALMAVVLGTIFLINSMEHANNIEIEFEKNRIAELFGKTIETKAKQFDIVSDTIEAFYLGSEEVTREEFDMFVSHMIKEFEGIGNVAVHDGNVILESFPLYEYVGVNPDSVNDSIADDNEYIALRHDQQEIISTLLLIRPDQVVSFDDILLPPYKLVLYVDRQRMFEGENNGDKFLFRDVRLSSKEQQDSVIISKDLDFEGHLKHGVHNFEYVVYQSNFANRIGEIWPQIFLAGTGIGIVISILLFFSLDYGRKIREANVKLKTNDEMLKKMQKLLLETEERFRNLFELSPVAVSTIDMDGNLTSVNQQAVDIFGYTKVDAIGQHFTKFVSDGDKEKSIHLFKEIISTGKIRDTQITCKRKDGSQFHTYVSGNTLTDKSSQIVGIIVVVTPL